jgi:hypothetical protein
MTLLLLPGQGFAGEEATDPCVARDTHIFCLGSVLVSRVMRWKSFPSSGFQKALLLADDDFW